MEFMPHTYTEKVLNDLLNQCFSIEEGYWDEYESVEYDSGWLASRSLAMYEGAQAVRKTVQQALLDEIKKEG